MKIGDGLELCCFAVLVSCFCDIPERKDVSSVKQGLLVRKPCIFRLASLDDGKGLLMERWVSIQILSRYEKCLATARVSWSA